MKANFSTGFVMLERMYADSTRRIHFSMEFLSNGGSSGFLLETCRLESADDKDAIASSPMVVAGVVLAKGGSERVSGDGKKTCVPICGRGDGEFAGDGVGDRIARADVPKGK